MIKNLGHTRINHSVYSKLKFKNYKERAFFDYALRECDVNSKFKKSMNIMAEEMGASKCLVIEMMKVLVEYGYLQKISVTAEGTTYFIPSYKELSCYEEKQIVTKETPVVETGVLGIMEKKKAKADKKITINEIAQGKIPQHWVKFKEFVFRVWADAYPKKTSRIKLENGINDFIETKLHLSEDEYKQMLLKIKTHTKWYIANTEAKYLKAPENYFLENKFEEPISKTKSTVMNKGFDSKEQSFETNEEIKQLFKN